MQSREPSGSQEMDLSGTQAWCCLLDWTQWEAVCARAGGGNLSISGVFLWPPVQDNLVTDGSVYGRPNLCKQEANGRK